MPPSKRTDPLTKLIADLALGRYDDRLTDLFSAFTHRLVAKGGAVRWRLTWDDLVIDEDNMTLLECETAERLAGKTWLTLDPKRSAQDCTALLAAALHHRKSLPLDQAREALSALTVRRVVDDVLSEYLSDPDPFSESSTGTPST